VDSIKNRARRAGLIYFLMALTGPVALLYVPGKMVVHGDAASTADHLRTSETLLRIGMASELLGQAMVVYLVMALYKLFKDVDRHQAQLLVILGALVSVPIMFVNVLNEVAALALAKGGGYLSVIDPKQRDALAYLFMRLHGGGFTVASVFWGLWLLPFGVLVIRSGFIPRMIGYLLFAAGASYLIDSTLWTLAPQYLSAAGHVTDILRTAELPVIFWLLIWGAKGPGVDAAIAPSAPAASAAT